MITQPQTKVFIFAAFLIVVSMFLMLRGPILLSSFFSNFGAVMLNHYQTSDGSQNNISGGIFDPLAAKQALQRSIRLQDQNDSAWRTLGYIWLAEEEEDEALSAWQHVPAMSSEMYEWANWAIDREDLASALTWHRRHTAFLPEFGDSWYHQGLILVKQKNWPEAISAFETATQKESFQSPLLSDSYFQLGSIYQWVTDLRDFDKALLMYDTALQIDAFSDKTVKAESYYKRGEIYGWLGQEKASASEFRKVLDMYPSHTWARLRHSYTRYWIDKELKPAEQEIKDVIAVWEESKSANLKWAYHYLGDIYKDAGLAGAAVAAYQDAAQLDPTDTQIQNKLTELHKE